MDNQQKISVRVAVLVKNGDNILLEKRANVLGEGTWAPPIGHLDYGETFEQTATREIQEETGLEIDEIRFRLVTNDVFEEQHEQSIIIWMEAKYVSGELRLKAPDEESDIGWYLWNDLPQPLFLPMQHLLDGQTYPSQTTEVKLAEVMDRVKRSQVASEASPPEDVASQQPLPSATVPSE